jgi:polysaccharide pyruvyl transferase WcaK-like protein/MoaA/NifB/PqqE/SkfB family radical SAM enzyme
MLGKFQFIRNLYLASQSKPWNLEKPRVIQFPVNDICNARCQMCNIWQQKMDKQITPAELRNILKNPLFSEVRTVGVNSGEPTLRRDLAELVDVLFSELPKLSDIALITNSLNSTKVIERITEVGQIVQMHDGRLEVMVSLDGVGEVHDRVRGREGAFEHAIEVIDFIKSSDKVGNSRLACTVIKENVYGLHDLLEFAIDRNIYIKYRLGIPHQRLYTQQVSEPFALSQSEKYHFAIFLKNLTQHYETSVLQRHFYQSLIGQLMYGKPRTAGCDWQHRGVTLSAREELLYCAVESDVLGSSLDEDSSKLYFNNQNHLKDIIKHKCDGCMHDYVGIPPFKTLLQGYVSKIVERVKPFLWTILPKKIWPFVRNIKKQLFFERRLNSLLKKGSNNLSQVMKVPIKGQSKVNKVLICGWYGTETLGDKAILGGVVSILQERLGKLELHLASLEPYISKMTIEQIPELHNCHLHTVSESLNIADSMDLVVFGGGPIMAIDPLAEMIAIFQRANNAQVPTLAAGVGVGPLGKSFYNKAIKKLLELASFRIYRDKKSLLLANSIGINTDNDLVAEDPAFTWLKEKRSQRQHPRQTLNILLGLRDWPYHQYALDLGKQDAEKIKNTLDVEIVATLNILIDRYPNLKITPFPMCTNHIGGDDRFYYRNLFRGHEKLLQVVDTSYLNAEISPLGAIDVFCDATVALTMRYHSLVFSLAVGTPALSIDYTLGRGKVSVLARKYDIPQISLDRINSKFMVKQLSKMLEMPKAGNDCIQNYPNLLFDEAMNMAISRMKLY